MANIHSLIKKILRFTKMNMIKLLLSALGSLPVRRVFGSQRQHAACNLRVKIENRTGHHRARARKQEEHARCDVSRSQDSSQRN
mmetsp:Transcript_26354/g.60237  ORF Transcript_26354/g.60237 Transcript_26354/m.60237 type:complete len:84 (-) Transcript_26354:810-1061(-)